MCKPTLVMTYLGNAVVCTAGEGPYNWLERQLPGLGCRQDAQNMKAQTYYITHF